MATKKKSKKTVKKATPARRAKPAAKKASAQTKTAARKTVARKPTRRGPRGKADAAELVEYRRRGLGAMTGGQSGDTQGISSRLRADSESVEELLEEGQTFEAEAIAGVENAPDPDQGEVVTQEFPEDGVPEEYRKEK